MDFTECTIATFMDAAFNSNFSIISKEEYIHINMQYMDASGLFLTREYELQISIQSMRNKINCVMLGVNLQREFIKEFGMPYLPALGEFNKYGYRLAWNSDLKEFETQLQRIEANIQSYITLANRKEKDLKTTIENAEIIDIKQSRAQFNKMLISLQKMNYHIDKSKTTMEDLATMIVLNKEMAKENGTKQHN